ncbi:MAG: Inosine-uridine preferring nucleoside hydrolase, partial [uncultured Chloroflexia bacterium]
MLSSEARLQLLTPPNGSVNVVIDTDTFNEVDDQFALVHALLSPERLNVKAIYAAPFHNKRSSGPGDGMEKSYQEILEILELVHVEHEPPVYRGAAAFLSSETTAVESDAAHDLMRRGQAVTEPLYVIALGALTNIASALLLEPSLSERLVVVWLGGHAFHWPHNQEFNLKQERAATRVLLASGVPLVLIPCMGVTSHLQTTVPEIERYVEPRGEVGQFLAE